MPIRPLSTSCKFTKVSDHEAAATTAVDSASVDMQGYTGVIFITSYGTPAANNIVHVEQSADDSSFADLAGSAPTLGGASDEDQWVDVYRPQDRYVRLVAARGTSSTLENIWAIQYGPVTQPQTNATAGTIAGETLYSPAEGTP